MIEPSGNSKSIMIWKMNSRRFKREMLTTRNKKGLSSTLLLISRTTLWTSLLIRIDLLSRQVREELLKIMSKKFNYFHLNNKSKSFKLKMSFLIMRLKVKGTLLLGQLKSLWMLPDIKIMEACRSRPKLGIDEFTSLLLRIAM